MSSSRGSSIAWRGTQGVWELTDETSTDRSRKERCGIDIKKRCESSMMVQAVIRTRMKGTRGEGIGAQWQHKHWWYRHQLEQEGDVGVQTSRGCGSLVAV